MLSKKRKSITGSKIAKFGSTTIKPSKARKVIRRYHVLINKRKKICDDLHIELCHNDEYKNIPMISKQLNKQDLRQFEIGFKDDSIQDFNIDSHSESRDSLLKILGSITNEIVNRGGLTMYQMASRNGQSTDRGGDSSRRLVQWIRELEIPKENLSTALEIGSLSCENAISTCRIFNSVVRIDLNNTNDTRGILKQDFMQRPLPASDDDKFTLISCSLVLNFVPTPTQRGDMVKRFSLFLKPNGYLFVVLPLPCINNSRYMDKQRFVSILQSQGFSCLKYHESHKLCYFLFSLETLAYSTVEAGTKAHFNKKKLRDGPRMNNFCICLNT